MLTCRLYVSYMAKIGKGCRRDPLSMSLAVMINPDDLSSTTEGWRMTWTLMECSKTTFTAMGAG